MQPAWRFAGAGWETAWEFLYRYGADHHPGAGSSGFFGGTVPGKPGNAADKIGNLTVKTVEGSYQDIALGPVAALESIKHLGTNGGGFFGANSATPFENPTVLSNMAEMLSMMLLPGACVVTFGLMLHDRKQAAAGKLSGGKGKSSWLDRPQTEKSAVP